MKIPCQDDLIYFGTSEVYAYWAEYWAKRDGKEPKDFGKIPENVRVQWMAPQIQFARRVIVALIADQLQYMDDGTDQGAARHRAVSRYCRDELRIDPITFEPIEDEGKEKANESHTATRNA